MIDHLHSPCLRMSKSDMVVTYANTSAQSIFDNPIGRSITELLPKLNITKINRRLERGRDIVELYRIEDDIDPKCFEIRIYPIPNQDEYSVEIINLNRLLEQESMLKSYNELIEQKNKALLDHQEVIRQLTERNPNAVLRIAEDRTILYANPSGQFVLAVMETQVGDKVSDELFNKISEEDEEGFELELENMWFHIRAFWSTDQGVYLLYFSNITPQKQNELLLSNLSRYFSPHVFRSIFTAEAALKVQTRRKMLTIFFSDIQGFTSLSERLEPELLTELLTEYLTEMTVIADKYGGTVDKYIGDAIMVFFGDPVDHGPKTDAQSCVLMALEMREKIRFLRRKWRIRGISQPLNVRMGIHSGVCTVGHFGSQNRLDYTAIGNGINLASRLEGKAESNQILISEETYLLVKDEISCRNLGEFHLKNISYAVRIFEVLKRKEQEGVRENMNLELPGLNLQINTDELENADYAIMSLQNILNYLKHSSG